MSLAIKNFVSLLGLIDGFNAWVTGVLFRKSFLVPIILIKGLLHKIKLIPRTIIRVKPVGRQAIRPRGGCTTTILLNEHGIKPIP